MVKVNRKVTLLAVLSLVMITASAFVLMDDNDSSGETISITSPNGEFTYLYDSELDMDGNPATKEVYLKSYNFSADFVTIPPTITDNSETYYVTVIDANAFNQKNNMRSVNIGSYVKLIKDSAFRECTALTSVDLKNVTEVGRQAFMHCTSLTALTAPLLETVGDYAFAILDKINMQPYEGEIPTMDALYLPSATKIGTGAFGFHLNNSYARNFGTVDLPLATHIGSYAFSQSKITGSVSIPSAQVLGDYAFHLTTSPDTDTSPGYGITIPEITSIGRNAFTGRALTSVELPGSAPFTIGDSAFMMTKLQSVELGMVSSIGTAVFDKIHTLEYINVHESNANYASLIGKDPSERGVDGALYTLNGGNPETLVKLPPGIRPILQEYGLRFIVADGVTSITSTAFERCPSISVDLNSVTSIPTSAFTGSDVISVSAKKVTNIGIAAFSQCTSLESFDFLDTGAPLKIGEEAFNATSLVEISLPKDTTIGKMAFRLMNNVVEELVIWSDLVFEVPEAESNAFSGTGVTWFRVISDATCADEAKAIYDGWNASGWSFGGSSKIPLLIIDNRSQVDISGLKPTGDGMIQIMNLGSLTKGDLQFIEYKESVTNPSNSYHRFSGKIGVYQAEAHSSVEIKGFDGTGPTVGTASAGDEKTWELVYEYYTIHFYSFSTEGDADGDAIPDGEDTDYINDQLGTITTSNRAELRSEKYLASRELKSLMWQNFVRYSLDGWYIADALVPNTIDRSHQIRANDIFEQTIPEEWIWRDAEDEGHLKLYAVFIGKEYRIELEARVSGGLDTTAPLTPSSAGGIIELALNEPYNGSNGFNTGTTGTDAASYPFGTIVTLNATPKPGYAFIGWGVVDLNTNMPIFTVREDRSLVQSGGSAEWKFELPTQLKYVAYFARTSEVTFDLNDGSPTVTVKYIMGEELIDTRNDYNGFDYDYKAGLKDDETLNLGKGTPNGFYPYLSGDVTKADLTFGGWYRVSEKFAGYDPTDLSYPTTSLGSLVKLPNLASFTLTAKWYATITFYPDEGTNDAALTGTGLIETSPGSGVYTYQHDVGAWNSVNNAYSATFTYGGTTYVPTAADVNFNGWYVLGAYVGTPAVSDIIAGTNSSTTYKDIYTTKKRLEPNTIVNGHISLMALYTADVEFYFNGADGIDSSITPTAPYVVTAPVSVAATMNDAWFTTINNGMLDAGTTGSTYKEDTKGKRMGFMGWYPSADGSTPPSTEAKHEPAATITKNIKLIAGWGVTVEFSAGDTAGTIIDQDGMGTWVPGGYGFTVLEGTVFDTDYSGMPVLKLGSKDVSAWYDADMNPYTWYADGVTKYTCSVTLVPEFSDLFQFNMMGGDQGVAQVAFTTAASTFEDVLESLMVSLNSGSGYISLTKTGLYYKTDGTTITSGERPNAVWYKSVDGTAPDYVNNASNMVPWELTETIDTNTVAYIRWLADVEFDVNGGTSANPPTITDVDEGAPFSSLASQMPSVPVYNAAGDKSFRGWFDGLTQYAGSNGAAVPTAPNITSSIKLYAGWDVEVKFYYTGTITNPGIGTLGSDANGDFITVKVDLLGRVSVPQLTKTSFTNGHLLWYEGGATVSVCINDWSLAMTTTDCFDTAGIINVNTTLYSKWYAVIQFNLDASNPSGFFANLTKHLLEGSELSDIQEELNPFPARTDWIFIGWYEQTGVVGYDNLGVQYYRTGNLPSDPIAPSSASSATVTKNVMLAYEFVVEVQFDCGYESGAAIGSQYLRVNNPIPDSTSVKFTAKPGRSGAVTFMGWWDSKPTPARYTENIRDSDAPDPAVKVTESMTLTAKWLVTVKFYDYEQYLNDGLQIALSPLIEHKNAGAPYDDDYWEMPEGVTIRQFIIADTYVSGKTFISWFVEQTLDGVYESGDAIYGLTNKIDSDITLTAGYGYTIHFDTNGGTPSAIADMLVIEGQSLDLPEKPAKGRLTFSGWNDGINTLLAGDIITPSSNTTYTAKWTVVFKLYDGISMTPIVSLEWDEDVGPTFDYGLEHDSDYGEDYGGGILSMSITPSGGNPIAIQKFIDRYNPNGDPAGPEYPYDRYYSVFNGWMDPLSGTLRLPTENLRDILDRNPDSVALFATWKERVRYYDGITDPTVYVDSGSKLADGNWADVFNPMSLLNNDTYRITNSMDLLAVSEITVTFDGNGGTPATQTENVISGTMLGMIPVTEPTRSGMFFAGWYVGDTRYSFTDTLTGDITLTAKWQSTPVERYTLFATAHENSTISPKGMISVMGGDTVTFTFSTERGYSEKVVVDGRVVTTNGASYTFSNVNSDHSIEIWSEHTDSSNATEYLSVDIQGNGKVLYSKDGGVTFVSYVSPLPLYNGVEYILKAVPDVSSIFDGWTGDIASVQPEITITPNGSDMYVDANFRTENFGAFGGGKLAILNLIFVIIALIVGLIALTVSHIRNHDGTGTGKAMRFAALFLAVISLVLLILTQGFGGSYVTSDMWTIPTAILMLATIVLALLSVRYDHMKKE